jgi:hypothetical protein
VLAPDDLVPMPHPVTFLRTERERKGDPREDDMCRNIKTLHNFEPPATEDEIHASALQYVRKLSGTTKPSKANEAAFERAVEEIAASTRTLLGSLVTSAAPRDRETEAERARERSRQRFGIARAG